MLKMLLQLLIILNTAIAILADNYSSIQLEVIKRLSSARKEHSVVESVITVAAQSCAHLISGLSFEKYNNIQIPGTANYVTCLAVVVLLLLKLFTIFHKYWKNGGKAV